MRPTVGAAFELHNLEVELVMGFLSSAIDRVLGPLVNRIRPGKCRKGILQRAVVEALEPRQLMSASTALRPVCNVQVSYSAPDPSNSFVYTTVSWTNTDPKAVYFALEVKSNSSLFSTAYHQVALLDSSVTSFMLDLYADANYSLRIRSLSKTQDVFTNPVNLSTPDWTPTGSFSISHTSTNGTGDFTSLLFDDSANTSGDSLTLLFRAAGAPDPQAWFGRDFAPVFDEGTDHAEILFDHIHIGGWNHVDPYQLVLSGALDFRLIERPSGRVIAGADGSPPRSLGGLSNTYAYRDEDYTYHVGYDAVSPPYYGSVGYTTMPEAGDDYFHYVETDTSGHAAVTEWKDIDIANAPGIIEIRPLNEHANFIAWTNASDNETGFEIQRSYDGTTGWTTIGRTSADVCHFTDSGLDSFETYYYRIRALRDNHANCQSTWSSSSNLRMPYLQWCPDCNGFRVYSGGLGAVSEDASGGATNTGSNQVEIATVGDESFSWSSQKQDLSPYGNGVDSSLTATLRILHNKSAVVESSSYKLFFNWSGMDGDINTFTPTFGNPFSLIENGDGNFVLHDQAGGNLTFSNATEGGVGHFLQYVDAAGNTLSATYGTGSNYTITRTLADGHSESYQHIFDGSKLASVVLTRDDDTTPISTATFTYYTSDSEAGRTGDLQRVTTTTGNGGVEVAYMRYNGTASVYTGGLKTLVKGESYVSLLRSQNLISATASLNSQILAISDSRLLAISDTAVQGFAENAYEYDSAGRVTSIVNKGDGCSLCTGGFGTTTFNYAVSNNDDDINSWHFKRVETLPDSSTIITYSNYLGQTLLQVTVQAGMAWMDFYHYQYDNYGANYLVVHAHPSAVTGYDESLPDLVGYSDFVNNFIEDHEGLIDYTDYIRLGTEYYLQDTYLTHGDGGIAGWPTRYYQSALNYTSHTYNGVTVYLVSDSAVFPNLDGGPYYNSYGARNTHYDYTFITSGADSTNAIASITSTLPGVDESHNGPGTANPDTSTVVFDQFGRTIWTMDAEGYINYTEYDQLTGAVAKSITDVNTSLTSDEPSGWVTPAGGGLHLVTTYVADSFGRTIQVNDPRANASQGGLSSYTVYDDANHAVFNFPSAIWSVTGGNGTIVSTVPFTMTRDQLPNGTSGTYSETLTFSGTLTVTGGQIVLPGFTVSGNWALLDFNSTNGTGLTLHSLSRSLYNNAGQMVESDSYYAINNVTYLATAANSPYSGNTANFYTTLYGYDDMGRQAHVVSSTGTITDTVYDALGRVQAVFVGTDDLPDNDLNGYGGPQWNDFTQGFARNLTGNSGTNMVLVSASIYDNGGVGDSNLTESIIYPGGGQSPRITDYLYDWRNRAVTTKSGESLPLTDVQMGGVVAAGIAGYNGTSFIVEGNGHPLRAGDTSDQLHYLYKTQTTIATLTAHVADQFSADGTGQAGVIFRESNATDSMFAAIVLENGSTNFYFRTAANGPVSVVTDGTDSAFSWVRISRGGTNLFTAQASTDGSSWVTIAQRTIAMSSTYQSGLLVTACGTEGSSTAVFDNVSTGLIYTATWTERDSVHRPLTVTVMDNLGEVLSTLRFDGDKTAMTDTNADGIPDGITVVDVDADGIPDGASASGLQAFAAYNYDEQGRRYRSTRYSVNPTTGVLDTTSSGTIVSNVFYDHRGNQVASVTAGGAMTKSVFDGAGRMIKAFTTDGGAVNNATAAGTMLLSWANANAVTNDIVLTQTEYAYDADGNVLLTTTRDRFHDNPTSATGELQSANSSANKARVSYMLSYYDGANRLTESVNIGTNGGLVDGTSVGGLDLTTFPTNPTASTDSILATFYTYNSAGLLSIVMSPAGRKSFTQYDNLGRAVAVVAGWDGVYTPYTQSSYDISNAITLPASGSANQTTAYTYDGSDHILTTKAVYPSGQSSQITQYIYNVADAVSGGYISSPVIYSNDLLWVMKYPDKTTGLAGNSTTSTDRYTYDALGEVLTMTNRNGTTHTYTYDSVGRLTIDSANTSIKTTFNSMGLVDHIATYSAAGGTGSVVNDIYRVYNGFGQVTRDYEYHYGAAGVTSPKISYTYSGGDLGSRLTAITYHDNGTVSYNYGTSTGLNSVISRLDSISKSGTTLENYSYLGYSTVVYRGHPQDNVNLTYIGSAITGPGHDWKMDDGSGSTTAADSVGSLNGTLNNGPAWQSSGLDGGSLSFDGSDDNVSLGGALTSSNTFTLTAWVNLSSTASNMQTIIDGAGYALFINSFGTSDKKVGFATSNGVSTTYAWSLTNIVPAGQWALVGVAVDRANGTVRIYVNGQDVTDNNSATCRTDFALNNNAYIGQYANGTFRFTGKLDEVHVYHSKLSSDAMARLAAKEDLSNSVFSAGDQYTGLDRFGRVYDHLWVNSSGASVDQYVYLYDRDSNVINKLNSKKMALNDNYVYDSEERITSDDRNTGTTYDQSWSYDALGNMINVTTNTTSQNRTNNSDNQLTVMGSQTLTYDNAGNLTSISGGNSFVYDAWNHLVQVKNSSGTVIKSYSYDGLGRRALDCTSTFTGSHFYSLSNQDLYTSTSAGTETFYWTPGYIDGLFAREKAGTRVYATTDAQYNVTAIVNTSGTVLERFMYDAFGARTVLDSNFVSTTDSQSWNVGYQGLMRDPTTGLWYNRARWYSDSMMRFINVDPAQANGLNWYTSRADNPINFRDPTGLEILSDSAKKQLQQAILTRLQHESKPVLDDDGVQGRPFGLLDRAKYVTGLRLGGASMLEWGKQVGEWLIKSPKKIAELLLGPEFSVVDWSKEQVTGKEARKAVLDAVKQICFDKAVLHSSAQGIELTVVYKPSDGSFTAVVQGKVGQFRGIDEGLTVGASRAFTVTDDEPEPFTLSISGKFKKSQGSLSLLDDGWAVNLVDIKASESTSQPTTRP